MAIPLEDIMKDLSPARRKKIEARAAELLAEEMSLRELRRAANLTQKRIAKQLHIGQEGVSRLEKRSDLLISTLRSYVEATGGRLELIARYPDRPPVLVQGFETIREAKSRGGKQATGRKRTLRGRTRRVA